MAGRRRSARRGCGGNVAGITDREARSVLLEANVAQRAARDRRAHDTDVHRAGQDDVVRVFPLAGRLAAFLLFGSELTRRVTVSTRRSLTQEDSIAFCALCWNYPLPEDLPTSVVRQQCTQTE